MTKPTPGEQRKINNFVRKYANHFFKYHLNHIIPTGTSPEHLAMVSEICQHLYFKGIPYITEFKMRSGVTPDIVLPTHVKRIIEVLHSETIDDFNLKKRMKYPAELNNDFIFISTAKKFHPDMIQ